MKLINSLYRKYLTIYAALWSPILLYERCNVASVYTRRPDEGAMEKRNIVALLYLRESAKCWARRAVILLSRRFSVSSV